MQMDRFKRPPTGEGFRDIGHGGEANADDSVEGHIMGDEIKDQDVEGHWRVADDDDVEGHGGGPKKGLTSDDDVEGHGGGPKKGLTDDEDVEGHWRVADDDDVEGHSAHRKL
jgi:hypothetical protein